MLDYRCEHDGYQIYCSKFDTILSVFLCKHILRIEPRVA